MQNLIKIGGLMGGSGKTVLDVHTTRQGLVHHGIARDEWVSRFKACIVQFLSLSGDDDSIPEAELESWPEQDEDPVDGFMPAWATQPPEAAAAEAIAALVIRRAGRQQNRGNSP